MRRPDFTPPVKTRFERLAELTCAKFAKPARRRSISPGLVTTEELQPPQAQLSQSAVRSHSHCHSASRSQSHSSNTTTVPLPSVRSESALLHSSPHTSSPQPSGTPSPLLRTHSRINTGTEENKGKAGRRADADILIDDSRSISERPLARLTRSPAPYRGVSAAPQKAKVFSFEDTTDISTAFPVLTKIRIETEADRRRKKLQSFRASKLNNEQVHEQYTRLRKAFEELDGDASGALTWGELQRLGELTGILVDQLAFKRMDKDRSGTVDFIEMLRCVYPEAPLRDVQLMVAVWGRPKAIPRVDSRGRPLQLQDQERRGEDAWKDRFDPQDLQEIEQIYELIHRSSPVPPSVATRGGSGGLTKEALRHATRPKYLPTHILDELFVQHDSDRDGRWSLREFAAVMEDTYSGAGPRTTTDRLPVHLHFTANAPTIGTGRSGGGGTRR
eukprot:TRINITY_DN27710_c0_g1_i1.p1 TRINITY_DN27710_c0_g1~~TRINITY_DN27710_c0_g1_i1.p1  ORF type:complete len:445 (+),score=68.96 TRINITY_DN27710_c0_g1_i1:111-1445(+)